MLVEELHSPTPDSQIDMNKQNIPFILCCFILFALGCEKDAPVESFGTDPQIFIHSVPDKIKRNSSDAVKFMIRAEDPQGIGNVLGVNLAVRFQSNVLLDGIMWDSGESGDIIAGDGVFFYSFIPDSVALPNGTISVSFQGFDFDGHFSSDLDTSIVVEEGGGTAPQITFVDLPKSLVLEADIIFALVIHAEDEDGDLEGIDLRVYPASSINPILEDTLTTLNGGEVFVDSINTVIFKLIKSEYFVRLQAFDQLGNRSFPVTQSMSVERIEKNDPPQILAVVAPDTVSKSGQTDFLVTAEVRDPQGREDIAKVILNSFRPDGSPASGNPFFLRDDGIDDEEENDGIYSRRFGFDQSNANGTYRFEIQAIDRSGAASNIVIHFITLTD